MSCVLVKMSWLACLYLLLAIVYILCVMLCLWVKVNVCYVKIFIQFAAKQCVSILISNVYFQ